MSKANETQVAGQHYQAKTQHWDYAIRALNNRYLEGNITKYVTRHRKKNGIQDLEKALHYLMKLIEEFARGRIGVHVQTDMSFDVHQFIRDNLDADQFHEAFVIKQLAHWTNHGHLLLVGNHIELLIHAERKRLARLDAVKAGAPTQHPAHRASVGQTTFADVLRAEEAERKLSIEAVKEDEAPDAGAGYINQDR